MKEITVENFSRSNLEEWTSGYSHKDKVRFAVHCAELSLHLCKGSSDAPRNAIKAAKDWIENPSDENNMKCKAAHDAAHSAYCADYFDYATHAAYCASDSIYYAGSSSDAADYSAAAYSATESRSIKERIIKRIIKSSSVKEEIIKWIIEYNSIREEIIKWIIDFNSSNKDINKMRDDMSTYDSYAAAKIANPECEIAKRKQGEAYQALGKSGVNEYWHTCNPADHCSTITGFLDADYELADGDKYVGTGGGVITVGDDYTAKQCNSKSPFNKDRFILSAAAIGGGSKIPAKPKHTKVEFIQIGFHKCHEAMHKHEMEETLYIESNGEFVEANHCEVASLWECSLYRKVETEISERDEFIDEACKVSESVHGERRQCIMEALFDSGKFKLVGGER